MLIVATQAIDCWKFGPVLGNHENGLFRYGQPDYDKIKGTEEVEALRVGKTESGNTLTSIEYFFEGVTVLQATWSVPENGEGQECRENSSSCLQGQR